MKYLIGTIVFCISIIFVFLFFRDIYDFSYIKECFMASQSNPTFFSKNIVLFYIYGLVIFVSALLYCVMFALYIFRHNNFYFKYMLICFSVIIILVLYQTISVYQS